MIIIEKIDNNIDHVSFNKIEKLNAMVAEDIKSELLKLFDVPNSKVIIDLGGISYIDSTGFGCFLTAMKAARNNYGKLKICNIQSDVESVFQALQLHTVLELHNDINSCINSF
ncbi:MAG: STAS domain-containing protein [Bacteroidales bacterium]